MLIGHQKQWQFMQNLASADRLPHAFLFSGQMELGKKKFSLEFAKLLQCEKSEMRLRPCGVCRACRDIEKGFYPDVELIEPEEEKEIKISQVRKLNKDLFLKPVFGRFRIGIVDEAHRMTNEAQNAFLKTLEEPKGNVILVLASSRPEMLLQTVRSRVSQVRFFPVPKEELEKGLSALGVSAAKVKKVSGISFGRPGRALKFIADDARLQNEAKINKEFEALLRATLALRFRYAKKITGESGKGIQQITEVWLRYLRNTMLSKVSEDSVQDKKNRIRSAGLIRRLQEIDYLMATTTVNPRLAIETFFLEL